MDGNHDVQVLRICSKGFYSNGYTGKLDVRLPNLKEVQLNDVCMDKVRLNKELTPKIQLIYVQNPTEDDDPDFEILFPELRELTRKRLCLRKHRSKVDVSLTLTGI